MSNPFNPFQTRPFQTRSALRFPPEAQKRVSKDSSYSPSLHLFYSRKYTSVNPTRILGKKAVGTIYLTLVDREVPVLLGPAFRAKDLCSLVKTKNVKPTLHLIHELIASFLEYNVKEFLL